MQANVTTLTGAIHGGVNLGIKSSDDRLFLFLDHFLDHYVIGLTSGAVKGKL